MLVAATIAAAVSNLVFVCDGGRLCAASGDGKDRRVIARAADHASPSLSRSGKRIAFTRDDKVFVARVKRRRGAITGLRGVRRIPPNPDGARDATQFDVALSPDGKTVAWVELRINVVSDTIDFRRYAAAFDGSGSRQVAASGGRPFVAWASNALTLREGLTEATDALAEDQEVDAGLCTASPASAQNGTCRGEGARQLAYDPSGRHLRHPDVRGDRLVATAYAYEGDPDNAVQRPGSIVLFDTATAAPLRDLTTATTDTSPVFSPDGRTVGFERAGDVFTVPTAGGSPKRLLRRAREPTWSR